ncbi:MAG: phosphoribosyl-AMP cyclohydrolase [Desulfobacteraceae bacterium 4572_89]|nr:MAG: phosphoribosyl-AMP cyclohydrolase [Desulfobacteraceae bacterium 4572_89]
MAKLDFKLDFTKGNGLIPAIAQDCNTGEVLMLAYMNQASFNETLSSGKATYYSRSRQALWKKGETSGHVQHVREIRVDCDQDTILLKVDQVGGAACHKGYKSCFFSIVENNELKISDKKVFDPEKVYNSVKGI